MVSLIPKLVCCRYAKSVLFEFIVGPRALEFMIHSALVAKQSPKLNALVNNSMKESKEQRADLKHEDPETFLRSGDFVERTMSPSLRSVALVPRQA